MSVVDGSFDHPLALEEHATLPLAGGIEQLGFQCGQLWGAAFGEINAAFSDNQLEAPAPPVSCAAMLAQKVGASGRHTVMAAGLAGGIGLSGGACGALGAAIWFIEMNRAKAGIGKVEFNSPEATAAIDRYLQSADNEFECSKIVGRKFENVTAHADYLRAGGCSKIIEALAACILSGPNDLALDQAESGGKS